MLKNYNETSEAKSASKLPIAPKTEESKEDESVGKEPEGLKAEEQEACPTPSASSDADANIHVSVELIAPQEVANYLQANSTNVTSNLRKTLSNVGYKGKFLVQAGFNPDLAVRGLKWEEILVILEDDLLKIDDTNILLALSNCIAPYSGIVFTPSGAHSLPMPPQEDGKPSQTAVPSPIIATYKAQLVDVSEQTVSTNPNVNVPNFRSDNSQSQQGSSNDEENSQESTTPTTTEEAQAPNEDTQGTASRPSRRRLYLALSSPLTLTSAVIGESQVETKGRNFRFEASIKVEMSPNKNSQDCPPGRVCLDPWCAVEFTSLSMSSESQGTYSLEEVQASAGMTPMSSYHFGLPTDNIRRNPGTAALQRTLGQNSTREWNAGVSIPVIGILAGANASYWQQGTAGLQLIEPVWNVTSHVAETPSENAFVANSKFKHTPSHTAAGQLIQSETFKPGPCSIFTSEADDRRLQIRIKTFWSSVNTSRTVGPLRSLFQSLHPQPLFANFWHELSFKLDLSRITSEESLSRGQHQGDIIQAWRTSQDGPHPPLESGNAEILDPQCSFPLQHTVVEALRDGREQECDARHRIDGYTT